MELKQETRLRFGKSIKTLRESKNLNMVQLGDLIGKNRSHISNIESGNLGVTLDVAESIAQALGCHVSLVDNKTGLVPPCLRVMPEQETAGQHPMTREEIDAFMASPSKYGVPPVATSQSSSDDSFVSASQLIQVIAQLAGYRVTLEKI